MHSTVPTIMSCLLACVAQLARGGAVGGVSMVRTADGAASRHLGAVEISHLHQLLRRQSGPDCGAQGGNRRCPNNLCCSDFGWCGDSPDHCDERFCQTQFGRCGDAPPEPSTTSTTSTTARTTTTTSARTTSSSTSGLPPVPSGTLVASTNGMCGNTTTCAGTGYGSCCSEYYWCGSSPAHCGDGCRSLFGTCDGGSSVTTTASTSTTTSTTSRPTTTSTSTTSSAAPPRPSNASRDARCGPDGQGQTCLGSGFGPCCSDFGWCGDGPDHCNPLYCQEQFGTCGL